MGSGTGGGTTGGLESSSAGAVDNVVGSSTGSSTGVGGLGDGGATGFTNAFDSRMADFFIFLPEGFLPRGCGRLSIMVIEDEEWSP